MEEVVLLDFPELLVISDFDHLPDLPHGSGSDFDPLPDLPHGSGSDFEPLPDLPHGSGSDFEPLLFEDLVDFSEQGLGSVGHGVGFLVQVVGEGVAGGSVGEGLELGLPVLLGFWEGSSLG